MSKLDMDTTPNSRQFKDEIEKLYGDGEFTMQQAKDALASAGLPKSKWSAIYQHVLMKHCGTGTRGSRCKEGGMNSPATRSRSPNTAPTRTQ